jgi:hypothetical protein
MRRLWLLALALAVSASAQAQTQPGILHLEPSSGAALGRISGAPNSTPLLIPNGPANILRPTDLRYDGRHRYVHYVDVGTLPVLGHTYRDLYLWDEVTGLDIKLTNFRGPLYVYRRMLWSNDRADTFLSFGMVDPIAGRYYVVRSRVDETTPAWGPAIVAAGASFEPFNEDDLLPGGRLEVVLSDTDGNPATSFTWTASDDVVAYLKWHTVNGRTGNTVRLHQVGDTPIAADPIVFDELVTGRRPLSNIECSPTSGQVLVFVRSRVEDRKGNATTGNPAGYMSFDLNNPAANPVWYIQEPTGKSGYRPSDGMHFHPDGTYVGFEASRISNSRVVGRGLYWMPSVPGGSPIRIYESTDTTSYLTPHRWTR